MKQDMNPSETISDQVGLRYKNIWRSIAYLIIVIIIVLSLIPFPEKITPFSVSDKLMHAIAYAVSMTWFGLCFRGRKLFMIGSGLIFMGIFLEIIQKQTGYRNMSFYDIVANCVGVLIGLMFSFSRFSNALQYIEERLLK